jgi:putative hydrolase of the HAD superfamily
MKNAAKVQLNIIFANFFYKNFMLKPHFVSKIKEHNLLNKPVRNIIFDLGNVVINIDPELTLCKFRELGFTNFAEIYSIMRQTDVFDRLDTGKITVPEFHNTIRDFSKINLSDSQIDDAWCAMLLDFPEENIELLRKLRITGYKLYLLSNTNEIHINYYTKYMKQQFGSDLLSELFDLTFYSHEIGFRKPGREAYDYVLKIAGLKPAETLFIDDLEHNVIGARQLGIQAYHHHKGNRLIDLFFLTHAKKW